MNYEYICDRVDETLGKGIQLRQRKLSQITQQLYPPPPPYKSLKF